MVHVNAGIIFLLLTIRLISYYIIDNYTNKLMLCCLSKKLN
jgi:hypothetical protein